MTGETHQYEVEIEQYIPLTRQGVGWIVSEHPMRDVRVHLHGNRYVQYLEPCLSSDQDGDSHYGYQYTQPPNGLKKGDWVIVEVQPEANENGVLVAVRWRLLCPEDSE